MLREYLPQFFDSYLYINQKPLVGNENFSVATALDIATKISELFGKKHKKYKIKDKSIFDVWKMTLDEAQEFFADLNKSISEVCDNSSKIMEL